MDQIFEFLEIIIPAISELFLFLGIVFLLIITLIKKYKDSWDKKYTLIFLKSLLFSVLIILLIYGSGTGDSFSFINNPEIQKTTFLGTFTIDGFIRIVKIIILCWSLFFIFTFKNIITNDLETEKNICFLFMLLGYLLALSSNNLILLFLGLEMSSIAMVFFVHLSDPNAGKTAASNMFFIHCIGSSLYIFGVALIFCSFGTIDCSLIIDKVFANNFIENKFVTSLSILFIILGLFSKMLFIPFQGIFKDIAKKNNWKIFTMLNFLPFFSCSMILIRFFSIFNFWNYKIFFLVSGLIAICLGFLNTVNKNMIKEIILYNTIGNTGIVLSSFAVLNTDIITSIFYFFIVQAIALMIFSGIISYLSTSESQIKTFNDIYFMNYPPILIFILGICILCFVGVPPLPGFIALLVLLKNLVLEEAYLISFFIISFKMFSIWSGIKIVTALLNRNTKAIEQSERLVKRNFPISILALCALIIFLTIKIDYFSKTLTSGEFSLKCYNSFKRYRLCKHL
ncbi:MAG: hypothetical protein LBS83_02720 [Holosporales bacterium]|jgi:NADH-quinone oxidoreductase subunit N|nr:hypothetical protein [Holosporales bacterium]